MPLLKRVEDSVAEEGGITVMGVPIGSVKCVVERVVVAAREASGGFHSQRTHRAEDKTTCACLGYGVFLRSKTPDNEVLVGIRTHPRPAGSGGGIIIFPRPVSA